MLYILIGAISGIVTSMGMRWWNHTYYNFNGFYEYWPKNGSVY